MSKEALLKEYAVIKHEVFKHLELRGKTLVQSKSTQHIATGDQP